jgi:hypothetical protein
MTEAIRSWRCLNGRCDHAFTAWEPNPSCPKCGCVRVNWIPGGGHCGGTAKAADAELRALVDIFKLPDINSAQRDRAAKKVATQPTAVGGPLMSFGPGFVAHAHPSQAVCVPTANKVNYKARLGTGQPLGPGKMGMPGIAVGTSIEAAHRPSKAG